MDCSICLSPPVFPVQLKCKHILCYLCVKGVINSTQKCPLCRKAIPKNLLDRPKFVRNGVHSDRPDFDGPQWFYEGKPGLGFWAYDFFNGRLLEEAYNSDQKMFEIMISGVEYCVDFVQEIQYRKDCPVKKRRIKRDLLFNLNVFKGIAGVPKHLVTDMIGGTDSQTNEAHSSGQKTSKDSALCGDTPLNGNGDEDKDNDHISKRIKIEIKEEPTEESDSSTF